MKGIIKTVITTVLVLGVSTAYAQKKQPNIILIMADDMGYSDIGSYGGEIQTPNIDRLASKGIRYKQFYNVARCCPSRASLMTGLYPHQAGMGWMAAADLGTPAYRGDLSKNAVTIAEVLKTAGYQTYMSGKWHLTNDRKLAGMVTDNFPKQRGFDEYFGIVGGGANYFTPQLFRNNERYNAPPKFYLTDAISDTSVKFIAQHFKEKTNRPMFMYVAYTAPHWPLHALQKDIDKYKELYKQGWDNIRKKRFEKQQQMNLFPANTVLTPRDPVISDWDSLSEDKKNEMAMRMAIYAAQIDNMDQGIGRIIEQLKATNQLDNTLIFFLSDNGACAEFISSGRRKAVDAGEDTFESYRIDWANVSSTPFAGYKHLTKEGGIATPLIIHWPEGIAKGLNNSLVNNYGHINDIMATCVEVAQAKYPTKYHGNAIQPMEGKSLVPHFIGKENNRGVVYWEHEANIAVRDGKWKLVASTPEAEEFNTASLKLYNIDTDPTEMTDLAAQFPDLVKKMYKEWNAWGKKVSVFPLDTRDYGVRQREYKRKINGAFDDNLAEWNITRNPNVEANISIDTTSKITGKKSALVQMYQPGNRPASFYMSWGFEAENEEKFEIKIKTKSNRKTAFFLRLENTDPKTGFEKVLDKEVSVATGLTADSFITNRIPRKGHYKLSLYLGMLAKGDKIWVDDIEIIPLK